MTPMRSRRNPVGGGQDGQDNRGRRTVDGTTIVRQAGAKVNLTLQILGKRPDGYHDLESLVVFADYGDELTIEPAEALSLQVTGPFAASLDSGAENLVLRAARGLMARENMAGKQPNGAAIRLHKRLPVAAGLGGGSADAAAVIDGLLAFWDMPIAPAELYSLARSLGADVPVCLHGQASIMSGIGEVITPAPELPEFALLLVNPGVPLATPEVFKARQGSFSHIIDWPESFSDLESFLEALACRANDLQAAAIALSPCVQDVLGTLDDLPGCVFSRLSGSGASCFGLFATLEGARRGEAALAATRPDWWARAAGLRTR